MQKSIQRLKAEKRIESRANTLTTHNTQQHREKTKEKKRIKQATIKEKPRVNVGGKGN